MEETSRRDWNGGRSQASEASEAGSGLHARGSEGPAGFKQWSDKGTCILERALSSMRKMGLRNGRESHTEVVRSSSEETMVALAKVVVWEEERRADFRGVWEGEFRAINQHRLRQTWGFSVLGSYGAFFGLVEMIPFPGTENTGREMVLLEVGTFGGMSVRCLGDS